MACYAALCYDMLCYSVICYATIRSIILHCAVLCGLCYMCCELLSCYDMFCACSALFCFVLLCFDLLYSCVACHGMLGCAMLRCGARLFMLAGRMYCEMPMYAMLCCAMLYSCLMLCEVEPCEVRLDDAVACFAAFMLSL